MNFETVSPEDFGRSLRGIGVNILVRDVKKHADFLSKVFGFSAHRVSVDFAIMTMGSSIFQLHSDSTYTENPLLDLLPENPPRGAGIEIRLYDVDPDEAFSRAKETGALIWQEPTDKPHGLREACILCDDGYAWVPSRAI